MLDPPDEQARPAKNESASEQVESRYAIEAGLVIGRNDTSGLARRSRAPWRPLLATPEVLLDCSR
jgi:hypothetical protein